MEEDLEPTRRRSDLRPEADGPAAYGFGMTKTFSLWKRS